MATEMREFIQSRNYVGIGFIEAGEKRAIDSTVAAQFEKQGFVKPTSKAKPRARIDDAVAPGATE